MGIFAAAATDPDALDVILPLVERFGLPLVVLVLIMFGKLVTGREYERMREDRDAEREGRVELQQFITEEVVPALTRSTDAVAATNGINERLAQLATRVTGGG